LRDDIADSILFLFSFSQIKIRVDLDDGDAIGLETFDDFVRVSIHSTGKAPTKFEGSVGLMGSYPDGQMLARDGSTIMEDTNKFGIEWQVHGTEPMLFHDLEGVRYPMQCQMPDMVKRSHRRLGETNITHEDAELACARVEAADRDACIFDVLATNSLGMAGSY